MSESIIIIYKVLIQRWDRAKVQEAINAIIANRMDTLIEQDMLTVEALDKAMKEKAQFYLLADKAHKIATG